jgi:hypothetical protein
MREVSMTGYENGYEQSIVSSNETAARAVAYLSGYLFWGMVGVISGGILLFQ